MDKSAANLVDFHCHLDLYPNFSDIINECERRKIYTLAVTTTPRAWKKNNELAQSTKYVRAALGLHPQVIHQYHHEVDMLCSMIPQTRYVGEIGLDGSPEYLSGMELQKTVLHKILQTCAREGGRIISLHSRRASKEVLDALEHHSDAGTAILHWFSGTQKDLKRAVSIGCWFSIGPSMLETKKGYELALLIPRDKILTETDGPFTKKNGKPLMPWDTAAAIEKLSFLWNISVEDARKQVVSNLNRLLKAE
ncbi:MAG: Qat anti-phage system TatD family nuclease QatD [Pseudomonadota bacterium]